VNRKRTNCSRSCEWRGGCGKLKLDSFLKPIGLFFIGLIFVSVWTVVVVACLFIAYLRCGYKTWALALENEKCRRFRR
jgi:hypothetical protein